MLSQLLYNWGKMSISFEEDVEPLTSKIAVIFCRKNPWRVIHLYRPVETRVKDIELVQPFVFKGPIIPEVKKKIHISR